MTEDTIVIIIKEKEIWQSNVCIVSTDMFSVDSKLVNSYSHDSSLDMFYLPAVRQIAADLLSGMTGKASF